MNQKLENLNDLVSLCKRRGFIFQSSEIYGGLGGCWDYGPLGVEIKKNVKDLWWKSMTYRDDIEGIDSSILMSAQVWQASGHVAHFSDPMVDCKNCKHRFRADKIDILKPCIQCGQSNTFTSPKEFNLMFKTHIGPVEDSTAISYLRPETAQGIFVNFNNVQSTMRRKLPFGIAQIGKAFRNEITPGYFIFRTREFEQMEMQYFCKPGTQKEFYEEWKKIRREWHLSLGIKETSLRFKDHEKLAHYAQNALDIEFLFPNGWDEIEGIHSRTDFDLKNHQDLSGKNMMYVDQTNNNEKYIPYVVETSVGVDRCILSLLCDSYVKEFPGDAEKERVVLKLSHKVAPIKLAILPLMKKDNLEQMAKKIQKDLQNQIKIDYDTSGSIGKRYRRQDEIGTPLCMTIDYTSLEDQTVTVRFRDSMEQIRIHADQISTFLHQNL